MNSPVDRFKKRMAILGEKKLLDITPLHVQPGALVEDAVHSSLVVSFSDKAEIITEEADALLAEIHGKLDDEKISALLDACQRESLQAVVRPFGLARVLFQDKEGGNVDTIHNVQTQSKDENGNIRFIDKNGREYRKNTNGTTFYADGSGDAVIQNGASAIRVYATDKERSAYGNRGVYDYYEYHDGNNSFKESKKGVSGGHDLDHSVSCCEIHADPTRSLAEIYGPDLANIKENHNALSSYYNRAKGSDTAQGLIDRLPHLEQRRAKAISILEEFERNGTITEKQKKSLDMLRNAPPLDTEKLINDEKLAKFAIARRINYTYYTGSKFIKNTALTSASEGGKMALQQAVGVLMEEFIRAAFAEVKDSWQNGFKGKVDDTFIIALKERLLRVADRLHSKWKDAALAFRDGFLSGFLSNVTTVIINMFITTAKRWVRILREGGMSLYRALKMLAFPPDGMSLAEAADAASKLIATGLVIGGGILLEEILEKTLLGFLGPLAPLSSYISPIIMGLVTGLGSVFVVYLLDNLDLFGVNSQARHENIVDKLNEIISISYDNALHAATVFDAPALLHLT